MGSLIKHHKHDELSSFGRLAVVRTCKGFIVRGRRAALSGQIIGVREPVGEAEWYGRVCESPSGIEIESIQRGRRVVERVARALVLAVEYSG